MKAALIVALLIVPGGVVHAQPGAQDDRWTADVAVGGFREAWDHNGSTETALAFAAGLDRRVWRAIAARGELHALRVWQRRGGATGDIGAAGGTGTVGDRGAAPAWLRGFTLGARARWGEKTQPFVDVAVGLSHASANIPPGGTRVNYLALIGAGVEWQRQRVRLSLGGRWFHVSNNGREGRTRNPDLQSLGVLLGVGW